MNYATSRMGAWLRIPACLALFTSFAFGQFNPDGWIRQPGWNFLAPLLNPTGCGGGGAGNNTGPTAAGNWVAPYNLATETPVPGDAYDLIDFGGAALSTGWGAAILGDPTWVDNATLHLFVPGVPALPGEAGYLGDQNVVDFQATVDRVNPLVGGSIASDNVLSIAQTYVTNNTGAPLSTRVCTASDDSIKVLVNSVVAADVSWCRGTAGDCNETHYVVLQPGKNKITSLVMEGTGGWGFRLALLKPDGSKYTDADADISFDGGDPSGTATSPQYAITRSRSGDDPLACDNLNRTTFNLTGNGVGADGDLLNVKEIVSGSMGTLSTPNAVISDVSNGGTVSIIPAADRNEPNITSLGTVGFVGTDCLAGSSDIDNGDGTFTSVSTSGGDIWDGGDSFVFRYDSIAGDFDISVELLDYQHATGLGEWGKFGLMAREVITNCGRYTMSQACGPSNADGARQAGRRNYNPGCGDMYETGYPGIPPRPQFLRLTRRGNVFAGWASTLPGLATGASNPCNDANWIKGGDDDWGGAAPASVFLGFANSDHNSDGCVAQTLKYRLLACVPGAPDTPVLAREINWTNVPRSAVNTGLSYQLSTPGILNSSHTGYATKGATPESGIAGVITSSLRSAGETGPVGIFDNSHDVGNPPTRGLTTFDGSEYTLFGSGGDIWDGGDDFQFAFKHVTGDFEAIAHRVSHTTNPNGYRWGRHGIMARWDCARDSKFSMVETQHPTTNGDEDWPRHHFRIFHHNAGNNQDFPQIPDGVFSVEGRVPTWHKLIRRGNTFYSYLSEDDGAGQPKEWVSFSADGWDNSTPATLLVGLVEQGRLESGATTVWDNVSINPLAPAVPTGCNTGAVLTGTDYPEPANTGPSNAIIGTNGGTFVPRVIDGKLRLTDESVGGSSNSVWYALPGSSALSSNGFEADFDVFMKRTGLPGDVNPADGMTFAVVEGNEAYLGVRDEPTGAEPCISDLPLHAFIGDDAGLGSSTTGTGMGPYVSTSTSRHDIWDGGDDFEFQYADVTGDFDITIDVTNYTNTFTPPNPNTNNEGRWGKWGLMAREAIDRCGRYTMSQGNGPDPQDIARQAGRINYLSEGCGNMYEDGYPMSGVFPSFLRLTRHGNVFRGYASTDGIGWYGGRNDDWGASAPATVHVGFANSEHNSTPAGNVQTVEFSLITCPDGAFSRSHVSGGGGGGLGYSWNYNGSVNPRHHNFAVEFDNWVNNEDPAGAGSTDADGKYHVGVDIGWNFNSVINNVRFGVPTASMPDIFAPAGIHARVIYSPNGHIDVYVSSDTVAEQLVASTDILPLQGDIILGFTGGTGGATSTQEVDNIVLKSICCEESPDTSSITGPTESLEGTTVTLSATVGGVDSGQSAVYKWSVSGVGSIVGPDNGATVQITSAAEGTTNVTLKAGDGVCTEAPDAQATITWTPDTPPVTWVRCDVDGNGFIEITDIIDWIGNQLTGQFTGQNGTPGPPKCMAAMDCDGSSVLDINDPVKIINFLYTGIGTPPESWLPSPHCENFPGCAYDGSDFANGICPP